MSKHYFDAVIFDLDGVITDTAATHSAAWKQMFDAFLRIYAKKKRLPFQEFTHEQDYLPYVDGKPRYQGVASFLASRSIALPFGNPEDMPEQETVCGLGNRKNELFNQSIQAGNIRVYQGTVDFIHELRAEGIHIGVASSSKNAKVVLETVGLLDLIETRVDGLVSAKLALTGKPAPDIFCTACDDLGVSYDRAVVVEDAISGVQAGQSGGFGLVLGVAREKNAQALKVSGADIVVKGIAEINIEKIDHWFAEGLENEKWSIGYFDYPRESEGAREALLGVGNGFFCTRDAPEENSADEWHYPGTYLAGLYNRLESKIGGRVVSNEDFVNVPNWLPLTFKINNDEWLDLNRVDVKRIRRQLDFKTGILHRSMVVADAQGRETRLETQRLASMHDPHLAALRYEIIPLNYDEKITVRSMLDGDIVNAGVARYRDLSAKHLELVQAQGEKGFSTLLVRTTQSNILIAEAARLQISLNGKGFVPNFETRCSASKVATILSVDVQRGERLTVDKLVAIYASHQEQVEDPRGAAQEVLSRQISFDAIQRASTAAWESVWEKIDIEIAGDRTTQKLIRLHLYHTLLTASPHNKNFDAGLPARGLHGEAYRGHIFWDELYIQPFLSLHFPETACAALMYRYRRLDAARQSAVKQGFQGAMFPWQSGSSGQEETQKLHLNPLSGAWGEDHSILQRHVSLAIARNIWEYLWVTDDRDFLENFGAEMFFEICRFWASKAVWCKKHSRYDIFGVMGPDEFHEKYPDAAEGGLKNNSYTNLLVTWILQRAFDLLEKMSVKSRTALREKIKLADPELTRWQDIAQKLTVPISEEGILEQFEGFSALKELDWAHYREKYGDIHRMDRILKAEGESPDAYQVAKQADALMIFYVLSEAEVKKILNDLGYAPPEDFLQKNFDYYLQRTSHGSTLSRLVHAYLAHVLGNKELSWQLYTKALKSDYMDAQGGTTKEGIHLGVMAGTIFFVLRAYAGIKFDKEILSVSPNLPRTWRKISFRLTFKGCDYAFIITPGKVRVKIEGKAAQIISLYGKEIALSPEKWQEAKQPVLSKDK
ncbi:MAG: beta-phosphoglucomutase family hydrolase [Anaerolineales bacterium]|nr:beta-phosphoglucomutase family hydrolase [Anaerolineales bacterium]